jgi:hypothetical protein
MIEGNVSMYFLGKEWEEIRGADRYLSLRARVFNPPILSRQ